MSNPKLLEVDLTTGSPTTIDTITPFNDKIQVSVSGIVDGNVVIYRQCTKESIPTWRKVCQYAQDTEATLNHGRSTIWIYKPALEDATSGTVHVVMTSG